MRKVSKRQAIKSLYATAGRIFFVEFVKKDGSLRRMTARLGVKKGITGKGMRYDPAAYGLLPVYDMDLSAWRMINLGTLKRLSFDHRRFVIE